MLFQDFRVGQGIDATVNAFIQLHRTSRIAAGIPPPKILGRSMAPRSGHTAGQHRLILRSSIFLRWLIKTQTCLLANCENREFHKPPQVRIARCSGTFGSPNHLTPLETPAHQTGCFAFIDRGRPATKQHIHMPSGQTDGVVRRGRPRDLHVRQQRELLSKSSRLTVSRGSARFHMATRRQPELARFCDRRRISPFGEVRRFGGVAGSAIRQRGAPEYTKPTHTLRDCLPSRRKAG